MMGRIAFCAPTDEATLRAHNQDSDRPFLVVKFGDGFVEVLSLVFAAREDRLLC